MAPLRQRVLAVAVLLSAALVAGDGKRSDTCADAACKYGPPLQPDGGYPYMDFQEVELEWRQEAVAHIASLAARHAHCQRRGIDSEACAQSARDFQKILPLREWAAGEAGWESILGSAERYEEASMLLQQAKFSEALASLEKSVALKLYPYQSEGMLAKWQEGFSSPGPAFQKLRLELADALTLMADSLLELAQERSDVGVLARGRIALDLAWALREVEGDIDAIDASSGYMRTLRVEIAAAAAEMLPKLRVHDLQRMLEERGVSCHSCKDQAQYLSKVISSLHIPVLPGEKGHAGHQAREPQKDSLPPCQGMEAWEEVLRRLLARTVETVAASRYRKMALKCRWAESLTGGECASYVPPEFALRCRLPAGAAPSPAPVAGGDAGGWTSAGERAASGLQEVLQSWLGYKVGETAWEESGEWGGALSDDPSLVAALRGFEQQLEVRLLNQVAGLYEDGGAAGAASDGRDGTLRAPAAQALMHGLGLADTLWSRAGLSEAIAAEMAAAAEDSMYLEEEDGPADEYREERDRQLQEELIRLARDNIASQRDSPLVPITLCCCVLGGSVLYLARRRRRRVGRSAGKGHKGAKARGSGREDPGAAARVALKAAISSGDAARLQRAIDECGDDASDPSLLRRARSVLADRRRVEKAAAKAAKAKAAAKAAKAAPSGKAAGGQGGRAGGGDGAGSDLATIAMLRTQKSAPERRGAGVTSGSGDAGDDADGGGGEWASVAGNGKAHVGKSPSSTPITGSTPMASPTSVVASACTPSPPSSESGRLAHHHPYGGRPDSTSSMQRPSAHSHPTSSHHAGVGGPAAAYQRSAPYQQQPGARAQGGGVSSSPRTVVSKAPTGGGRAGLQPPQQQPHWVPQGSGGSAAWQQQQLWQQHAQHVSQQQQRGRAASSPSWVNPQQQQQQQRSPGAPGSSGRPPYHHGLPTGPAVTEAMASGAGWGSPQQPPPQRRLNPAAKAFAPPTAGAMMVLMGAGGGGGMAVSQPAPSQAPRTSPISPIAAPLSGTATPSSTVSGSTTPAGPHSGSTTPQHGPQEAFPHLRSIWSASTPLDLGPPALQPSANGVGLWTSAFPSSALVTPLGEASAGGGGRGGRGGETAMAPGEGPEELDAEWVNGLVQMGGAENLVLA